MVDTWDYARNYRDFSDLKGKNLINVIGLDEGSDQVVFTCSDGTIYSMFHSQDCCEFVRINDVCGDVEDLIDALVVDAYESTNSDNPPDEYSESHTWTFYHIQTTKGSVMIRWLGESNGYYSEGVDFKLITLPTSTGE